MYGVVLWSDRDKNCAVIWCEDHRNLAYYKADACGLAETTTLVPGDLVEFDVNEDGDVRLAVNPSLVSARHYSSLPQDLVHAKPDHYKGQSRPDSNDPIRGGHVLRFPIGSNDASNSSVTEKDVDRKVG